MEICCFLLHFSVFPLIPAINTSGGRSPHMIMLYCTILQRGRAKYAPFFLSSIGSTD